MTDERFEELCNQYRRIKILFYLGMFCAGQDLISYIICWRTIGFQLKLNMFSDFIKINPVAGWAGVIFGLGTPCLFSGLYRFLQLYEEFCENSQLKEAATGLANLAGREYYRKPRFIYFLLARHLEVFYEWALKGYEKERRRILETRKTERRQLITLELATLKKPFEIAVAAIPSPIERRDLQQSFAKAKSVEEVQLILTHAEARAAQNAPRSPFERQTELLALIKEATKPFGICLAAADLQKQADRAEFVKDANKLLIAAITIQRRWNKTQTEQLAETANPAKTGESGVIAFD